MTRMNNDGPFGNKTNEEILESLKIMSVNEHRKALNLEPVDEVRPVELSDCSDYRVPVKSIYNCPNCCAPISGAFCEYCGTNFYISTDNGRSFDKDDNQIVIPIYIGNEQIDEAVVRSFRQFHSVAHNIGTSLSIKEDKHDKVD